MEGIDFLVDSKGNPIAVQIDLRKYREIWEDFYDTIIAKMRENEPTVSWEEVKADLIAAGKW